MLIGWSYLHVAALASSPILRGGFHSLRLFCASTPWKEKLRGLELSQSSSPPPPMRVSDHAQSMAAKKLFSRPRHPSLCFRHAVRKKTFLSFYLRCSSPSSVSQLFFLCVCLVGFLSGHFAPEQPQKCIPPKFMLCPKIFFNWKTCDLFTTSFVQKRLLTLALSQ